VPELRITVNPNILKRLREEDEALLMDMQQKFDGRLSFRANPAQHMEEISIINAATNEELYANVTHEQTS